MDFSLLGPLAPAQCSPADSALCPGGPGGTAAGTIGRTVEQWEQEVLL